MQQKSSKAKLMAFRCNNVGPPNNIHCYNTVTAMCYRLPVGAGCQQWTSQMNTNYANGQGNPATTVQQCQAACLANTGCNGVDWVTTASLGRQCWLSGTWSGARESTIGVTHYDLNRNCAGKLQHFDLSCNYVRTSWFGYIFYHKC